MKPTESSVNLAKGFRPAKHCAWITWIVQLWNAIDLTWHNRLHLDPRNLKILKTIPKDSGLILAANHSDETDPRVFIELSRRTHLQFTYMINAEAFEEWCGAYGWLLQRLGGFSVERSGNDQAARRYAVDVVKKSRGALIMFPEGEISYLNDLVQPFKTGVIHTGLQAITETRGKNPPWTVYLLPVAIKYRYRKPIGLILNKKIRAIEKRLLIRKSFLSSQERIIRIMTKILKRQELISRTQMISEQLMLLKEQIKLAQAALLSEIEIRYPQFQIDPKAQLVDRAQKMIFFLRQQLSREKLFSSETKIQLQKDISNLKRTIQMAGWQPQYIDFNPSEERLAETIMKLEREVFHIGKPPHPLGNRNVFVRIGHPINLGRYFESYQKNPSAVSHQITEELRDNIQSMIKNII
jgi:1-acyl-sn-glycerol-3-phosphate acyltransferase